MVKLRNNKGVLLLSSFMIGGLLFVFSGIYVTSTFVQRQVVERHRDSLQDFYAAEIGTEYAFLEAYNRAWNFTTHEQAAIDQDGDGYANDLVPLASPPSGNLITGTSINPVSGCYEIRNPNTNIIMAEVKVYSDPDHAGEILLLSRSQSIGGNGFRIIKTRLAYESLYKFLLFFPGGSTFKNSYDGNGVGGIHVNGDVRFFNGVRFSNLTEISSAGYFSFTSTRYPAPYRMDDDWDGSRNGVAWMYNASYPPYDLYPTQLEWNSNPWGYVDFRSPIDKLFHGDAKIDGITIPKILDKQWTWDRYKDADASANPGGKAEIPVVVRVPAAELAKHGVANENEYWVHLYGANPNETQVNMEWWVDKVYGNDRASGIETTQVKYTNSQYQADEWQTFLKNNGLDEIVMDKNSGGKYLTPVKVRDNYDTLAKDHGVYIGDDGSGGLEVYINGVKETELPCWVEDNIQFFNAERPRLDAGGNPLRENVIQFDINKLITLCADKIPSNNIIYVANKNLRVVNAAKLPEKGLTVVSPYNIYLKGNFNTDTEWQPAAVISNSYVYALSNNFNDPQTFPLPYWYKNYPYELEFQEFLDNYCAGSRYPGSFPAYPPTGLTWSWIKSNLSASQQDSLRYSGENYYRVDNASLIANYATNTVLNVAIATAETNPYPKYLENWYYPSGKVITVTGSFIRLNSSWANDCSVTPCVPIWDRPGIWRQPNSKGWGNGYVVYEPYTTDQHFNYEARFKNDGGTPPGDFGSAAVARWEEVNDFNHHNNT